MMAVAKYRTVRLFEPVVLDQDDNLKPIGSDFWPELHKHVAKLKPKKRQHTIFNRKIEGAARTETSPAVDYFYVGRYRPGADWPDTSSETDVVATLASTGFVGNLIEPAYLLPVSGTNYVAVMRTSAGPTPSTVERWLGAVAGYATDQDRLVLRPYVKKGALERLAAAQRASKLYVKVDPDVMDGLDPDDDLGRALKLAQSAGAGGVSVAIELSFGHATPTDHAGDQLVTAVNKVLDLPYSQAVATIYRPDEDNELIRDVIDFNQDRLTIRQQVGESEDEEPTPSTVLASMSEAIREFRKQL